MKHIIAILLIFIVVKANAQFSLRANGVGVDILYTAPLLGQGNIAVQGFGFAVQIANPQGALLTATFTPGLPLASIATFTPYTGTDNGKTTFAWASAGVPNYASTYNFTAAEVVLGTIAFTPTGSALGADVFAVDYQFAPTYGGNGTGVAIWTMQVRPVGDDVTDYLSLFYQSAPAGGVPGSTSPNTNADYGSSNQQVGVTLPLVLPVNLLSFTATERNCNAAIAWKTANEVNTKNFEVQTSTDGTNFTNAATIAAKGGTSSYGTILQQQVGTAYYRLKSVDNNGAFTYSNIVPVKMSCQAKDFMTLYPNPLVNTDLATLSFSTFYIGKATVTISNAIGEQILTMPVVVKPGVNTTAISTRNLISGAYYMTLTTSAGTKIGNTIKLLKL